jgi:predicted helicase
MRVNMQVPDDLEKIVRAFIEFKPAYIEQFELALEEFKKDIPSIVDTLRDLIEEQNKTNATYKTARDTFWEMCKQEINPAITVEDIREMVIQHILTEDLFKSVFAETDFHHENNIARELERLVNTFMNREVRQNQLSELNHYYSTLNAQAAMVADHHEKQQFLKVVYENFYKTYNPKGADRLGVVYTPNEIVDFMIRSTDYLLEKHFGRHLHDQNVHILDPATGTGTFITDIIEYIPAQYLEYKYTNEIHANEVAILPYYVANLNIEFTYKQRMGQYKEFPNICFVDTLDNTAALTWDRMKSDQGVQASMFAVSSENAERIRRQNQQKISVVIGNPPYNAKQENYNYQNSNRAYERIDQRIKDTFIKEGTAQNQIVVYDMFVRFFRWAADRLDENGIIAFVSNNIFIDGAAFDGFRKVVENDFSELWIINLKGNARTSGERRRQEAGNVFDDQIRVGIAVYFLVKKGKDPHFKLYYNEIEDYKKSFEKKEYLANKTINDFTFERLEPSKKNNWINLADNDFDELIPLIDKEVKAGKSKEAVFELFSSGVKSQRDEWVYDFSNKELEKKVKFMIGVYQKTMKNPAFDEKMSIKWDADLERYAERKISKIYNAESILKGEYRPFITKYFFFDKHFNGRTYQWFEIYSEDHQCRHISISGLASTKPFQVLSSDRIPSLDYLEKIQSLPFYYFDKKGTRKENITDWGLEQFREHYGDESVTKEDIFLYTYGVLHNPAYRTKYELNLKREFPRLPFYEDFHQWAEWGKTLMELHINYEQVEPFGLQREDVQVSKKPKAKLRANKEEGTIQLDENTRLTGIPPVAWEYILGNRSALEWILDQYKEKKPRDATIREKFNTYKFADYKEQVIELLDRVTTVSVRTMAVIGEMEGKQ